MFTGAMDSSRQGPRPGKKARFLTFPALLVVIIVQVRVRPLRPGDIVDLVRYSARRLGGLREPSGVGNIAGCEAQLQRGQDVLLQDIGSLENLVDIRFTDTNHTRIILRSFLDLFLVHVASMPGGASL